MRVMAAVLFTTAVFLGAVAFGEDIDEQRGSEASLPYSRHRDPHHGHNHVYPDRGAIFRDLPRRAVTVNYAGVSYRFADGIWFEPRGPAFIVVAPPIGLMVPSLPGFATTIQEHGESYLYANDVYYRPRPDLGGYEVVNDPGEAAATAQDTAPSALTAPASAAPASASAAAAPAVAVATALPTVAATSVSAAVPTATAAPAVEAAAIPGGTPAAAPAAGAESVLRASPPPPSSAASMSPASAPAAAPAAVTPAAVTPVAVTPAAVAPAAVASTSTAAAPPSTKVIAYPRNGQSAEQQARDHYECYQFGVAQSGFDPVRSGAISVEQQSTFDRAQNACFEGRGYTVR
jgi:hypothetical protein